jgi:type III restriction enzyme
VEIKGYHNEDAKDKASTMRNYWILGVNNLGKYVRWAFVELQEVFQIQTDFAATIEAACQHVGDRAIHPPTERA